MLLPYVGELENFGLMVEMFGKMLLFVREVPALLKMLIFHNFFK